MRAVLRIGSVTLAVIAFGVLAVAMSAANTVPASNLGRINQPITVQDLAPPQCAGMGLVTLVTNGTAPDTNSLVLGTAAAETLTGGKGNDCLVGGAGNDNLIGKQGTDVCLGGAGTDTFTTCETAIQ
jgi:Ca2+-binding RTX toxin-like protein